MADRVGVIAHGKMIVIEEKNVLMKKLGSKQLILDLHEPIDALPQKFPAYNLHLSQDKTQLTYTYDGNKEDNGIAELLHQLCQNHVHYKDLNTKKSSLEEIFINLVRKK